LSGSKRVDYCGYKHHRFSYSHELRRGRLWMRDSWNWCGMESEKRGSTDGRLVAVVDHELKCGLPQGPGWHRYNWDGYGSGRMAGRSKVGQGEGVAPADGRAGAL